MAASSLVPPVSSQLQLVSTKKFHLGTRNEILSPKEGRETNRAIALLLCNSCPVLCLRPVEPDASQAVQDVGLNETCKPRQQKDQRRSDPTELGLATVLRPAPKVVPFPATMFLCSKVSGWLHGPPL